MCAANDRMKKLIWGAMLWAVVIVFPIPATAGVEVGISISLPPPIVFTAPPELIVLPDTYVYVVPDLDVDIFFYNGWWWRPWEGRWYRSHYYDRGWGYYNRVPGFYFDVDPGWRGYYRNHDWYGHRWNYERIPHGRLQENWRGWKTDRHWERQGTWGVQSYQPRPQQQRQELRQQRQLQYQQRPEVQKLRQPQEKARQPQRPEQRPQVQQPQRQEQRPEAQQPQRQEQRPQVQQPQRQEQRPEAQQPQRQEQRPQVQQPQRQEQRPEAQQPQRQEQRPQVQQPQRQEQRPQAQQPQRQEQRPQPQGRPERGEDERHERK